MSIKEKPLINAVSRLGPLPGFLFSHPIFTGFFAMFMCPVFGAVFMLFQVAGRGTVEALALFEAVRVGAIVMMGFAVLIYAGIAISAFRHPDEMRFRLLFVLGGALCVLLLVALDFFTLGAMREYFTYAKPIV